MSLFLPDWPACRTLYVQLYGKGVVLPHVTKEVYATASDCSYCVLNRTGGKGQRYLKLFFPESRLKYIGMSILGPLLKITHGYQSVYMMMNR